MAPFHLMVNVLEFLITDPLNPEQELPPFDTEVSEPFAPFTGEEAHPNTWPNAPPRLQRRGAERDLASQDRRCLSVRPHLSIHSTTLTRLGLNASWLLADQ
jgi:hypothetical protein